jgi:hypothetical protein
MIEVKERLFIGREPDEVFAFLTEASNFLKWQEGVEDLEVMTPGPWRVGTRIRTYHSLLVWKRLEDWSEVTGLEPGRLIRNSGSSGKTVYQEEFLLEPAVDGCHLHYRAEIKPGGIFAFIEGLAGLAFRNQMRRSFARLKTILEKETFRIV